MARAHFMKTSRVAHTCGRGGHEIPAGQPYYWAAPGFRGRKQFRCKAHPFKRSELTTSLASQVYAAQEALSDALDEIAHDSIDALSDLEAAWDEFKSEVESYAEQRRESASMWENGNSQLEELADIAEAAFEEVESHDIEEWSGDMELLEPFTEPEPEVGDEPDRDDYEEGEEGERDYDTDLEAWQARVDERDDWETRRDEHEEARADWEQHVEQQIEAAREVAESLEV